MTISVNSPIALGYQQIFPVASTGLTVPAGTRYAIITTLVQAVRWRDDGVAPTAAVGYPLAVGTELKYDSGQISNLKIIQQVSAAEVNVCYYG